MKRNGLDMTVVILGIACIGLLTVNRYILRPLWQSEFRTEMRQVKSDIREDVNDSKDDIKEAV